MDESLPDSKHTGCISTSAILSNNYDIKGSVFKVHLCPTHYRAHACKWRKWCRKRSHSPSVTSLKCLIRLLWHKFWAKKNMKIQSMLTEPIDDFAHQWLLSTHFAHWRLWSTGFACQWLSLTGFAHQQLLSTDFTHQSILLQIQAQLDTELFRIYTCMSMCYQMETCISGSMPTGAGNGTLWHSGNVFLLSQLYSRWGGRSINCFCWGHCYSTGDLHPCTSCH